MASEIVHRADKEAHLETRNDMDFPNDVQIQGRIIRRHDVVACDFSRRRGGIRTVLLSNTGSQP